MEKIKRRKSNLIDQQIVIADAGTGLAQVGLTNSVVKQNVCTNYPDCFHRSITHASIQNMYTTCTNHLKYQSVGHCLSCTCPHKTEHNMITFQTKRPHNHTICQTTNCAYGIYFVRITKVWDTSRINLLEQKDHIFLQSPAFRVKHAVR